MNLNPYIITLHIMDHRFPVNISTDFHLLYFCKSVNLTNLCKSFILSIHFPLSGNKPLSPWSVIQKPPQL